MGTELVTAPQASTPIACATRFSTTSLEAAIPAWLDRDLVDADTFHLPATLPDGAAMELSRVADDYRQSLAVPASHDDRTATLGELRLKTATRNENEEEARARFRLLRAELADVPIEILREACSAYARSNRFFPSGPAEILPLVKAIVHRRQRTAWRLRQLAKHAIEQEQERTRLERDPLTPEAAAAIIEEFGLRPETAERIRPSGPARRPTVEDYVEMGVDRETAERCLAERKGEA